MQLALQRTKWIVMVWILFTTCQTRYASHWIKQDEIIQLRNNGGFSVLGCTDAARYIPDEHFDHRYSTRVIRINLHFMNSTAGDENYSGAEAKQYGQELVAAMNYGLENNKKMNLPEGNSTPVLKTHYRVQLADQWFYEHTDDLLYFFVKQGKDRNNYSRAVINKYQVHQDSILNIFIMPHHPDSIRSNKYRADWCGIALGNHIKVAGLFENKGKAAKYMGLVNHELGHVFGLTHAWGNDGCDDTPEHANCWNVTGEPPCEAPTSNNMMDYNAFQQAITPCQIGKVHKSINRMNSRARKLVIPTWCQRNPEKDISISDTTLWDFEHDIEGNVSILDKGVLEIQCRTSIPENGQITVHPQGTLIINNGLVHNSCGKQWKGIEVLSTKNDTGQVIIEGNGRIENSLMVDN